MRGACAVSACVRSYGPGRLPYLSMPTIIAVSARPAHRSSALRPASVPKRPETAALGDHRRPRSSVSSHQQSQQRTGPRGEPAETGRGRCSAVGRPPRPERPKGTVDWSRTGAMHVPPDIDCSSGAGKHDEKGMSERDVTCKSRRRCTRTNAPQMLCDNERMTRPHRRGSRRAAVASICKRESQRARLPFHSPPSPPSPPSPSALLLSDGRLRPVAGRDRPPSASYHLSLVTSSSA